MKNTPTPETDSELKRICGNWNNAGDRVQEFVQADFARKLERERDEARDLCRWAFPRLSSTCDAFDVSGTGRLAVEEMNEHPEIFGIDCKVSVRFDEEHEKP